MDTPFQTMNPEVARLRRQSEQRKLRRRLRHVRLLWSLAGALLVLLLFEVLLALSFSPRFWIYRIDVLPAETLTQAEVIHLMALPPHSNYYRVSLTKLEERLRRDPRVETARVTHGMVGALVVEVHERQAVCQVGETAPPLYMDRQGYLFTRPAPPTYTIPVIDGLALPPLSQALGRQLTDTVTLDVLQALAQFGKIGEVTLNIAEVNVANGMLDLQLSQGPLVHVGLLAGIDLHQQARCMEIVLTAIYQHPYTLEQIAVIDISHAVPEKGKGIVYTPKPVQEAPTPP